MKEDKYCFSAVVTSFERMVCLLGCKSRIDVVFHTGVIPHDRNELDKLVEQYKDNVTKYVVDGDDVFILGLAFLITIQAIDSLVFQCQD